MVKLDAKSKRTLGNKADTGFLTPHYTYNGILLHSVITIEQIASVTLYNDNYPYVLSSWPKYTYLDTEYPLPPLPIAVFF